jgi:hypothetical protein
MYNISNINHGKFSHFVFNFFFTPFFFKQAKKSSSRFKDFPSFRAPHIHLIYLIKFCDGAIKARFQRGNDENIVQIIIRLEKRERRRKESKLYSRSGASYLYTHKIHLWLQQSRSISFSHFKHSSYACLCSSHICTYEISSKDLR